MYTGKADRNAVYKTHKFFNRECKKGRSLFFLSVISAAAILAGTVLTGCRRADDLVQEQAEPENYALNIRTGTHLLCGTHQHSDLSFTNFLKQFFLFHIGFCFVDKSDFAFGNTSLYELFSDVVVDRKCSVILWCR
mgnify:CR=1 FL=1